MIALANGKPAAGTATMAEACDVMERDAIARGKDPSMRTTWRRLCRMLVDQGVLRVADLDDEAVREFIGRLADSTPQRRGFLIRKLVSFCNHLVRLRLMAAAPKFPTKPTHPSKLPRVKRAPRLSRADAQRLLDGLRKDAARWEGHRLYALYATAIFTGLRRKVVCRLRVEDIDLERGEIRVRRRPGMHAPRAPVRFPAALGSILADWLPRTGCEWAFPNATRSGPWVGGAKGTTPFDRLRAAGAALDIEVNFESLHEFHVDHAVPTIPGLEVRATPRAKGDAPAARPARLIALDIDGATRLMAYLREHSADWDGHRLYALAGLALLAGLRRAEVLGLRTEDVRLDRSPAILRIPGRPPVVLTPEADGILRGWLGRPDRGELPLVFPGGPLTEPLRRAGAEVGIPGSLVLKDLSGFWLRCGGRVELGAAWREATDPAPVLHVPHVRGPVPKKPRSRKRRQEPGTLPDLATWDPPVPAVRIGEVNEPVFLLGEDMGIVPETAHEALRILLGAFPRRLSYGDMTREFHGKGWRSALDRLRTDDPRWLDGISFPGDEPGLDGYAIVDARTPTAHFDSKMRGRRILDKDGSKG